MSEFSTASSSPPILIWQPEGGVPGGPVSNPPVYSQADVTQLVEGQAYIDVVFGSIQTTEDWVLVACEVENTTDFEPLNIWPGIITDRTAAGFRLQLNGMPDSPNYYLHWAVSGINIVPVPATLYQFTGPSLGPYDPLVSEHSSNFTVKLPPSTMLGAPITITPSDGGTGGVFSPSSVTLSSGSASATFTYTPASYGTKTISVTNSGTLIDPASIAFTPLSVTYTLSGPSSGASGAASSNFTVALPVGGAIVGTVTVTPHDGGGGGTFTPATVNLTTGIPSRTFTYTAASTGAKTISVTNSGGLTDPANLTYTATLADGSLISTWLDSSVNGHDATQSGSARPIYKVNIINGKPVVRFVSASSTGFNLTGTITGAAPWTVFCVAKQTTVADLLFGIVAVGSIAPLMNTDSNVYFGDTSSVYKGANPNTSLFHVMTMEASGYLLWVDGTSVAATFGFASGGAGDFGKIGYAGASYSNGDIAELICYNVTLSGTDRANIEKYLGTKYAITVAGGSAVQPDTVTGIKGWWKADSIT